jgi:NADH-quinone oxidoreductase subunit J
MIVFVKHPIFSVVLLATSFILASFLLFLLECELLALLLLVIYLGAVVVLFLFAIMMLELKIDNLTKNKTKYVSLGLVFGILLLLPLFININISFTKNSDSINLYNNIYQNWHNIIDLTADVNVYGQVLYSYYVLQFLVSGLILMLMLIGIVYLTNTFYKQQLNNQLIFKQLSRNTRFF